MTRRTVLVPLAALIALGLAAACSDADLDDSSSTRAPEVEAPASVAPPAAAEGDGVTAGDASRPTGLVNPLQMLVVRADVAIEVADVGAAVSRVVDIARRHQGLVYDSTIELGDPGRATGELVLRLPSGEVDSAIADLGALGTVVSRSQTTDDVTDQMIDLEARILTARASVESVRALMAQTKDLSQLVFLESELNNRQTVLEQLLAHQRNLANDVALATLTVRLSTAAPLPVIEGSGTVEEEASVGSALRDGWDGFVAVLLAVAIGLAYVAPLLALLLVAAGVWLVARRASRARAPQAPRTTTSPLPDAPAEPPVAAEHLVDQ